MPNRLIGAHYSLSVKGEKLKLIIFSKVDLDLGVHAKTDVPVVRVTAQEWQELCDSEQPYRDLHSAYTNIVDAEVCFDGDPETYKFFENHEYLPGKGEVVLQLNRKLLNVLLKRR